MIEKSSGMNETERLLAEFCERTFLRLWTYPNLYNADGDELCDLLAVFGDSVFVFFVRERKLAEIPDKDPQVLWDRWKRNVVDRQIATAHGAERYIKSGRPIFLNARRTEPFPLEIDPKRVTIHKILIAHGAKEACERASEENIYGSLAISYSEIERCPTRPFHVIIDKGNPVHIFDSHNVSIILGELDTVTDFTNYLEEKLRAIRRYDLLAYCGEEDLLAHYLYNYDEVEKRHFIGTKDDTVTGLTIGEGEWRDFIQTSIYRGTKAANKISYQWDELIQRTCQNALNGILEGNSDLLRGPSAIFEMVKEPRFIRRVFADRMRQAITSFPDHPKQFTRQATFFQSLTPDVGYVFFQLRVPEEYRQLPDHRGKRQRLLEIACGAAKNKIPHLTKVIGIGMDAPKFSGGTNSEDFILMPCEDWSDELRDRFEEENKGFKFFETDQLRRYEERVTEFVFPTLPSQECSNSGKKIGRNDRCPCGSGKKYKRCHGSH